MAVEEALGLSVVGDGLSKIEGVGCPAHVGDSESGRTIPGARSRRTPGSPEVPALLSLSWHGLGGAPPRDAHLARGVGKPQQEMAVAGARRAEAHQIASAQFIERTQQMVLVHQPSLVLGDDGRTVAVAADPKWVAPFAATSDVDGGCRNACVMLVENPAHFLLSSDLRVAAD